MEEKDYELMYSLRKLKNELKVKGLTLNKSKLEELERLEDYEMMEYYHQQDQ